MTTTFRTVLAEALRLVAATYPHNEAEFAGPPGVDPHQEAVAPTTSSVHG